jgi:two-component system cell cycle sensor histidine kinase/response regulator CckA
MNADQPIYSSDVLEIDRPEASRILATLIEASPLAIVTFNPDGVVTMWNPAAERIFGWSENEALGTRLPFVPAEKQEEFLALRRRALGGEVFTEPELHRRRADGSPIVVSVSTSPLRRPDGTIYGIMSILMDVTERKAAEESRARLSIVEEQLLRQSEKMEAVGRLAGGVAHDFNNLLTAISGYSDLLLHRLPDSSTLRRDVEEIRKAGDRAAALTRQLLAFSRRQVLEPKVLDLNAVVARMEEKLRRTVGGNVELSTDLSPSLSRVKADPAQIEQVILNLAVNARDAMPDGGRLSIATADAELSPAYAAAHAEVHPGPHVLLSVSDTGQGMSDEIQAHLFEPFFTTKERGKGTGLGLATVYGIVQQSGGHIRVNSAADRGSTFLIYLPRVEAPEDSAPGADLPLLPRPSPGTETVLLAEDEEVVRGLAREILVGNGYKVLEAGNGREALLLSEAHRGGIDLLLTDVQMPKMSGRELGEQIRVLRPGLKVLYMSGYTDDPILRIGIMEAGIPFLQKPFTADELARKVREVLDSEVPDSA